VRDLDPGCCLAQLFDYLAERKSWAHDPEQKDQEWRLVPREGRKKTLRDRRAEAGVVQDVQDRETRGCWERWKKLSREERQELIRDELLENSLTASEIADRLDGDDMRVYVERVRPQLKQMVDDGVLEREEERYRGGASIRYRYSLADGGREIA
jgi:hypothetical protein